jgi:hypothetical protein
LPLAFALDCLDMKTANTDVPFPGYEFPLNAHLPYALVSPFDLSPLLVICLKQPLLFRSQRPSLKSYGECPK